MASQVTLQRSPIEICGCRCQVHCWRGIGACPRLALFPALVTYQLPCTQIECQGGELGRTGVEIDAVQVMAQDAVDDFSGREGMELLPVHGNEHIESFAQEVTAAHAGIEHGEAGEIERR